MTGGRDGSMSCRGGTATRIVATPHDQAWDSFLAAHPDGHYLQSSLWARLKANGGGDCFRIRLEGDTGIVAGAQVFVRSLAPAVRVGYVPRGPVLNGESPELTEAVFDGLDELVRSSRLAGLIVQPGVVGVGFTQAMLERGFRVSPISIAPEATAQIDLSADEEEMRGAMTKSHRRSLRRSVEGGLIGRLGTGDDLPFLYELYSMTSQRQGFRPHSREYFETLWSIFHPSGNAQIVMCEAEGEVIAGQILITFGRRAVAKYGGWTGSHRKLGPNHLMDWTAIQWAKSNGHRWYEIEGLDRREARLAVAGRRSEMRQGPGTYKLDFGGEVVEFPRAHALVPNRFLSWGYFNVLSTLNRNKALQRLRNRLRTK